MEEGKILARIPNGGSSEIRVRQYEYNSVEYIDVRKFYYDPPEHSTPLEDAQRPATHFKPTKKGVSLTPKQWTEVLPSVLEALEEGGLILEKK